MKGIKKGFYLYMNSKRKTQDNVRLLLKAVGELVRNDMEEVKILSASLLKSLQIKQAFRNPRPQRLE